MEDDIRYIKWMLIGIYILLLTIGGMIFRNSRIMKARIANHMKTEFLEEAQKLQDEGDFDALNSVARERVREYPNDATALFYLGFAQFKLEYYSPALTSFNKLQKINPVWEKETVAAYIAEIKDGMKRPYLKKSNKARNEMDGTDVPPIR